MLGAHGIKLGNRIHRKGNGMKVLVRNLDLRLLTREYGMSKANEPVKAITSHFFDENNKLQTLFLDTVSFEQEHSSHNLSSYFKIVVENGLNLIHFLFCFFVFCFF